MFLQAPLISSYDTNPIIAEVRTAEQTPKPVEPTKPEPKLYTIVEGDNLTKIAEVQQVPLERLWAANPELTDPNLIKPSQSLKIPLDTDVLEPRPYPAIVESVRPSGVENPQVKSGGSASPGNTYTPGQCTWGVKNWRPSIPNGWGNASQWLSKARAQGWATGSTPKVGAVGWTSGHVVLILAVKGDTVTIREMNYNFVPYSVRTVDRPASKYMYIY